MAIESVTANSGTGGAAFAVDTITGTVQVPYVKLMSGTDTAEDLIGGDATNGLDVDVTRVSGSVAVTNAGLTELAAAINASSQVDVNIAASAATVAVSNAGLTELAAAINASSQMDVNIAASNATITVASHAVTNAGTFATQVDGAALTALQLIDDTVYAEDVAAQAADKGIAILAVRRDADTSLVGTDNDYANLQVDANGYLKVEIFDGGGSHTVDNAGTFAVQVDGSALTALQLIDNPVLVDDAAFTPATSSVMMAGFEADEGSTDSVDEGDAGAARMTLDRKVIVNPQPHTAGGLSIFRSLDLDETEEDVKTSAGQIYAIHITNFATSTRFIKFSNATAANTTVGTTAVFLTIPVPGNASDDTTLVTNFGGMGVAFDTALCAYATTGLADNDTGAPAANDCAISVFYK